jgi:hypothetical protein
MSATVGAPRPSVRCRRACDVCMHAMFRLVMVTVRKPVVCNAPCARQAGHAASPYLNQHVYDKVSARANQTPFKLSMDPTPDGVLCTQAGLVLHAWHRREPSDCVIHDHAIHERVARRSVEPGPRCLEQSVYPWNVMHSHASADTIHDLSPMSHDAWPLTSCLTSRCNGKHL